MGDKTSISWTDATWNPIRGCRRTAPAGSKQSGCGDPTGGGCYAERQAARFAGPGGAYEGLITLTANGPRWSGKTRFVSDHLLYPVRWRTARRIFTDSMSDLFYEGFRDDEIDRVVAVMMICATREGGNHVFQTLTKRPARMRAYFADGGTQERVARAAAQLMEDSDAWFDSIAFREEGLVHPNIWWGVSVENQAAADERIPELLRTPAAVRFLSCEPLIGPVDLEHVRHQLGELSFEIGSVLEGNDGFGLSAPRNRIDWVIVGCESGPGARPCEVAWLRSLRDQCAAAGVSYFLKQATATPGELAEGCVATWVIGADTGSKIKGRRGELVELPYLDGVQHTAMPEAWAHVA